MRSGLDGECGVWAIGSWKGALAYCEFAKWGFVYLDTPGQIHRVMDRCHIGVMIVVSVGRSCTSGLLVLFCCWLLLICKLHVSIIGDNDLPMCSGLWRGIPPMIWI